MDIRTQAYRPMAQPLLPAAAPQAAAAPAMEELKGSDCPWTAGCQKGRSANPNDPIQVSMILKAPPTPARMKEIQQFAKSNGMSVASIDPQTRTVKLQGTSAQYQKALGVQLNTYKDADGNQFRSYEGTLKLPKALCGDVMAVLGLDTHPLAHPNFVIKDTRLGGGQSYTPEQLAGLYNFPKGDGKGQTIGIIELGGGYSDAEMQQYFKNQGVGPVNLQSIGVDGGSNAPEGKANGPDGEVCLDVEVAGTIAPGANIKVYFAPNTDQGFIDAVAQAAKDGAQVESISWGAPESAWSDQSKAAFVAATKDAATAGTNIYAASGDGGSKDRQKDGANHADFPASGPWVIGTGGTKLTSANGQRSDETAWNDGFLGGAGGGGVSDDFPLPDFQKGAGVPAPTNPAGGRGVPDVSADADPATGYQILVDGQTMTIGGTSAVAPLYAGLTAVLGADAGKPLGFLNPFFYQHPQDFNDITRGNNGGFSAGPGWDAVTGLGSPDGSKLLADLTASQQA